MSLIRSAARRLRLGKYKHFQGTDLNGAPFPPCSVAVPLSLIDIIALRLFFRSIDCLQGTSSSSVHTPRHPVSRLFFAEYARAALADLAPFDFLIATDEWRQAKRYVEYLKAEPLSEYGYKSIPELQSDVQRQLKLQENVRRLEQEYREEKMRLAEAHQAALLQAPDAVRGAVAREGSVGAGVEPAAEPSQEGLPLKDGGAGEIAGKRAAEIARRVGTGESGENEGAAVPEGATPEEMAEIRRRQEQDAAMKRRAEFAKENPTPLRGNPGDAHRPAGWTPSAPARRRE
ncbi:putative Kinesin K39 [Rhodotorula toruloides ATCC 204091]|uniref:Putative kinesin K39 n=1 Tax=Rhodotorula toruloides TaxID=5286 RepID=A0A0K3CW38_RHOTO|nr:putative Kinesin K39 [Rhodotorula toruloides ATCC 204091]PRQ69836.1 putative kinesin K39 [Rhodotorula toruloides]